MNAAFGWIWLALGFLSGAVIGLYFDRPGWLGGYDAYRRRLVRLGHIALVALGLVNVVFELSLPRLHLSPSQTQLASAGWIVGAVAMPLSCFITAWRPAAKPLFAVPVIAFVTAAVLTLIGQVQP